MCGVHTAGSALTFVLFFLYSSAGLGSMNSAIEVKDTPSEDLPLDEDYLGECWCSNSLGGEGEPVL